MSQTDDRAMERVADLLGHARRLLFVTGAGLSADSGLPTYRGRGGLYNTGRTTSSGVPIEQALSGPMLARRPEITWLSILELERPRAAPLPTGGTMSSPRWRAISTRSGR